MNNETARERLELAVQLRKAGERHSRMGRELTDQAFAINKEVEAHFETNNPRIEASEAVRRPVSLHVMPPLPQPRFDRLAAAVSEDRKRFEAESKRRRRPIVDRDHRDIETQDEPARWRLRLPTAVFTGLLAGTRLRARAFFN